MWCWAWRTTPPTRRCAPPGRRSSPKPTPTAPRARGLPTEFIEVAEAKAAAINAAFDTVMRERRAMALQVRHSAHLTDSAHHQ